MILAALGHLFGIDLGVVGDVVAPAVGIVGVGVTGVLLVWDLKRPLRFLYIFLKPNPRSWLFWGSVVLGIGAALFMAWLLIGVLGATGVLPPSTTHAVLTGLAVPTLLGAVMVTGYTGFLVGQAEGRDLWQSPLLFWHLVVQAAMVGGGALVVAGIVTGLAPAARTLLVGALTIATGLHVVMLLFEYLGRHATSNAAAAAHMVTHGRYARLFWFGGIGLAVVATGLAVAGWAGPLLLAALAGLVVQAALPAYESVFVRAGQDVPLS